jgi:hypothetical protein
MLSVFGIQMNATRGLNQAAMVVIPVAKTLLSDKDLDDTTVCPNGIRRGAQHAPDLSEMLRARLAPPQPPSCVPSPYTSCNTAPPS